LKSARGLGRRARHSLEKRSSSWPPHSPGVVNAWLLFVTSKPPTWEDAVRKWEEQPLTIGTPHEGFFYPDPLGFWAEVRRWSVALVGIVEPGWHAAEALAVSALLQIGDDTAALKRALEDMRPRLVVFLDETAWQISGLDVERRDAHHIPDPHRDGQFYEGFWGVTRDGVAVGKAPHHPAAHRLYRRSDIDEYLAAAPV
jgi:hypothetical protein